MKRYIGNWFNDTITKIIIRNPKINPHITESQELNAMRRMNAPMVVGKLRHASVQGGGIDPYMDFEVIRPAGVISAAAAAMGRKGGAAKSERKTIAVRENGKKGGRPRKEKTCH